MLCIATALVAFAALFGPVDGGNTAELCSEKQRVFGMSCRTTLLCLRGGIGRKRRRHLGSTQMNTNTTRTFPIAREEELDAAWADLGSCNKSEAAVSTAEKFLKVALAKVKHAAAMK
eukprot:281714-Rhodomonas_salina.1